MNLSIALKHNLWSESERRGAARHAKALREKVGTGFSQKAMRQQKVIEHWVIQSPNALSKAFREVWEATNGLNRDGA
ncbi:MAG: hypothetical protein ACJ8H8_32195 [Geminicoccaceae bacterium]